MEPMHRAIKHQVSSHVPRSNPSSNSSEQAHRPIYMGSELGRTEHEHFQGYVHLQHLRPQPHPYPFRPTQSLDMREAIQIEIEKERIREEIIMSEIVRRHIEAEVRRELMMMDRDLALQRGSNGFPFHSPPVMGFNSPLSATRADGGPPEEKNLLNESLKDGEIGTSPFQRGTPDLRMSEVKPVPVKEGGKEKEKIILVAKPDGNVSGSKRKAVTPPPGGDVNEFISDGVLKKKGKGEWSCGLCQVHANSERVLNAHIGGKKHKAKEAALKADGAGKNCSTGLSPKITSKSVQVMRAVDPGKEVSSKKSNDLQDNLNSDKMKKNESVAAQKVQKNSDLKKNKLEFWCEMCQVGAPSEKVMNGHKNGKKHAKRLRQRNRNGGAGPSDE